MLLCPALEAVAALPEVPGTADAAKAWQSKREREIHDFGTKPKPEMLAGLGEMLRQLKTLDYRACDERDAVISRIQKLLLAIPGHAEYYRDRILKAREEYDAKPLSALKEYNIDREQEWGFETLAQLPSPETVRVLGEFLSDDRGLTHGPIRPKRTENGRSAEYANSSMSLTALNSLPIVNKPVAAKYPSFPGDRDTYRLWYEQIKAGTRTFRFEGDPTEYDLDGPAPPEKLRRIAAARQRDERRDARHGDMGPAGGGDATAASGGSAAASAPRSRLVGIATGFCLVLAALWYLLRRRARKWLPPI